MFQGNGTITIQPNNVVAAEFAAKVARAIDSRSPVQSPPPDPVLLDRVSDSDELHKHSTVVVPISERVTSTLNTASKVFVPQSFAMQNLLPSEAPIDQSLQAPVVIVPTVSAETDSPPVEIQRSPVITKNILPPTPVIIQSPLKNTSKKQKSSDNERQQATAMPPPQPQAEVRDNKKGPNNVPHDEYTLVPKERREKKHSVTDETHIQPAIAAAIEVPNAPVAAVLTSLSSPMKENKIDVESLSANKTKHQNGETVEEVQSPALIPTLTNVIAPTESKYF